MSLARKIKNAFAHLRGRLSGTYYAEDFVRVYPDGMVFDRDGKPGSASLNDINNYLNHRKFYLFVAQFVKGAVVADIGCGSGYGCAMLKDAGASRVYGADLSEQALGYARERYGGRVEFSMQGITDLREFPDSHFGVTISSEVLEHIKEYGKEDHAIEELKRITRPGGLVILGTPNSELLGKHGFSFEEIDGLMKNHFRRYRIFENALLPTGKSRRLWEERLAAGRTGVIVTERINLKETVLLSPEPPEIKRGVEAGVYHFDELKIDTTLLHNTHSWVVIAIKDKA
ncbi:MAG TPA: class I SAM-dependent methyltransferase [Nitrospirota bacterium]|nr:class I SAM-dependent methyltransferase [Nitrospirota bacterium]